MKSPLLPTLLVVVQLGAAAASGQDGQEPRAKVVTAAATDQTLLRTIVAFGEVQPDPEAEQGINAGSAGQVTRLWVRAGQQVAAGAPLIELSTDPNARLLYEQARAQLAFAETNLARVRELFAGQLATRTQVADAEKALADARNALAAQEKLGAGVRQRVIRAPFAGIVSRVDVKSGDRVAASFNLLNLAARQKLVAVLGIEPEDAPLVPANAPVTVEPVSGPGAGVALRMGAVHGMVNPATRLVDAIVALHNGAATHFLPGVRLRAQIVLGEVRALAVPRAALLNDGEDYLFAVRDGRARRVVVQRGVEWQGLVGVESDLKAGDRVVIEGNTALADGMAVAEATP